MPFKRKFPEEHDPHRLKDEHDVQLEAHDRHCVPFEYSSAWQLETQYVPLEDSVYPRAHVRHLCGSLGAEHVPHEISQLAQVGVKILVHWPTRTSLELQF